MLNLIRADLYKSFHRVYFYIVLAILAGLAVFLNAVLASSHTTAESALSMAGQLLVYPLFVICALADITTAEENKEHTLKNTVACGTPRLKLYLAKNVSTAILGLVAAALTVAVYVASAFILMPSDGGFKELAADFAPRLGIALLLYVAACALATLLGFLIKKNALFTISYFGLLVVPTLILKLLGLVNPVFGKLSDVTLYRQAQLVASVPDTQLMSIVLVALAHILVFTVAGLLLFKHQEVI
jgi:ABC-2 type transport system permease protein